MGCIPDSWGYAHRLRRSRVPVPARRVWRSRPSQQSGAGRGQSSKDRQQAYIQEQSRRVGAVKEQSTEEKVRKGSVQEQ